MNGEVFDGLILFIFFMRDREVVKGEFLEQNFQNIGQVGIWPKSEVLCRLGYQGSTGVRVVGVRGREH